MTSRAPSDLDAQQGAASQSISLQAEVPPLAATDVSVSAPINHSPAGDVAAQTPIANAPIENALVATTSSTEQPPLGTIANVAAHAPAIVDNGQMAELKAMIDQAAHAGPQARKLLNQQVAGTMANHIGTLTINIALANNVPSATLNLNFAGQGNSVSA